MLYLNILRGLTLIATLLMAAAFADAQTITGNITTSSTNCSASAACASVDLDKDTGSLSLQVTGTFSATLQFEGTVNGSTWVAVQGDPLPSGAAASSATSTGAWTFNVAGLSAFRVRASAHSSGTAVVALRESEAMAKGRSFGTLSVTQLNSVRYADQYSGADAGAKITACFADLPSTGGICDARGLTGAQSAASTITLSKNNSCLLLGSIQLTMAGDPMINTGNVQGGCIVGGGPTTTKLIVGADEDVISVHGAPYSLEGFEVVNVGATYPNARAIVRVAGSNDLKVRNVNLTDFATDAVYIPADSGRRDMYSDMYITTTAVTVNAFHIDGVDATSAGRYFVNIEAGAALIDIEGAQNTIINGSRFRNVVMASTSSKLIMSGSRIVPAGSGTTFTGSNHVITGTAFGGWVIYDTGVVGGVFCGNVTTGAGTVNTTDADTVICDMNVQALFPVGLKTAKFASVTNCSDSAGDAACGAAPAGAFVIDAADTTTVVSTTAVTANSQIFLQVDSSLGTRLGVTCNTQDPGTFDIRVTARTAATSFTVTADAGPTTNPLCVNFFVVN